MNLIITGKASSNVFDGVKNFDAMVLKGIQSRGTIGFLSYVEHFGDCEVKDSS